MLEPVVANLDYNQIMTPSMSRTQRVEKRTWAASFLKNTDQDQSRRVFAIRVAPPSHTKQGVKIKVENRSTLRVLLDTKRIFEEEEEEGDDDDDGDDDDACHELSLNAASSKLAFGKPSPYPGKPPLKL